MKNKITSFFKKPFTQILSVLILTSLPYLTILKNGFVWDDIDFIINWKLITSFSYIPDFFKGAVPPGNEGVYRPIRGIFYVLSYKLWGVNPLGYHLQGIIIHFVCVTFVYLIARKLTKNNFISTLTAVLFGVHPVHTEAVAFATHNFDLMGIMFAFISFYFYLTHFEKRNKISYFLSLIFCLLALFTNEIALTLPLIIAVHHFLFSDKKDSKLSTIHPLSYWIPLLFYAVIRFFIVHVVVRESLLQKNLLSTLYIMSSVFIRYLATLILPLKFLLVPNTADTSVNFGAVIASIIIIASMIFVVKNYRKNALISFLILWFYIGLTPLLNIISTTNSPYAERHLYFASFAYCLGFILALNFLLKDKKVFLLLFSLIIIYFSFLTFNRNRDWKDSLTLWSKAVEVSPNSVTANVNLALAQYAAGQDINSVIDRLKKAAKIDPMNVGVYKRLGLIYTASGDFPQAINAYEKALKIDPRDIEITQSIGFAYYQVGNYDRALEYDLKTIKLNPNINADIYYDLALAYLKHNNKTKAIEALKKSVKLDSTYEDAKDLLNQLTK